MKHLESREMETELFKITDENRNRPDALAALKKAGRILRDGGLVAFPTETVYGLGLRTTL